MRALSPIRLVSASPRHYWPCLVDYPHPLAPRPIDLPRHIASKPHRHVTPAPALPFRRSAPPRSKTDRRSWPSPCPVRPHLASSTIHPRPCSSQASSTSLACPSPAALTRLVMLTSGHVSSLSAPSRFDNPYLAQVTSSQPTSTARLSPQQVPSDISGLGMPVLVASSQVPSDCPSRAHSHLITPALTDRPHHSKTAQQLRAISLTHRHTRH